VRAGGFERDLVGARIPARRMQQRAGDAGLVHVAQQLAGGVARHLAVEVDRLAAFPDMDLRIDDQHVGTPWVSVMGNG
jgi:hypothetical protein